ncbi:hypothetical protein GCM10011507_25030 [Edaphobacter acidisoli]|uniref:Uncharacterized protein n=1 Tax=Edaphobacter acidisoli TaxID=2040573 RepID=A0A916RYG5_9BACT|nr:hypothetical protein GCM10011507_25030 [Edaphobacter acidisoli]
MIGGGWVGLLSLDGEGEEDEAEQHTPGAKDGAPELWWLGRTHLSDDKAVAKMGHPVCGV